MKLPVPDRNLVSRKDIEDRVQSIYRQRAAEIEKGPRRTRTVESRPGWQDAHCRRLEQFDRRVDALQWRLRRMLWPYNSMMAPTRPQSNAPTILPTFTRRNPTNRTHSTWTQPELTPPPH